MDEILASTLRTAVLGQLDYLDAILGKSDSPSKSALADTVIPQLTAAWRELLAAHEPDRRGRCRSCASRGILRRTECAVWRTAHRHLVADAVRWPVSARGVTGRHQLRSAST